MRTFLILILTGTLAGLTASLAAERLLAEEPVATSSSGTAETPQVQPTSPISLFRSAWQDSMGRINQIEAVQMVSAVLAGSQMGPGDAWFHPSQSRYDWQWLAQRYDLDGDEMITADEFSGPPELFQRLDRDRNSELKADDFDWSDASPFLRQQGQAGQWFSRIDNSSNGRITPEEWQKFYEKLAGEKGYVSREDLRIGLFPPAAKSAAPAAPGSEGPSQTTLLLGILGGELGSLKPGPRIGQQAPDFELETQDHKQTIRLSTFRNEKPVVLVFGSFT